MPPYRNYIYEYHAKITSGEIIAGKWIKKIYEIIINGLQKQEYFFNAKAANKAIRFIENFCHHSKGRNDLIKLELWQKAIVSVIFGIQDAEKIRIFREIFIVIGRKNGKSLFASAIIAYMAYLEPEYGQEIYCLAPKLDQAALVYDGFYQMVQAEDELAELAKKRRSDIYIAESNTVIKPIAFNAKKSDGFNPQLVVCDEMAAWSGDAGLKQYEVMKSALGARTQPMILSISTAGYINDSIYDELMKRSTSFLKGNSKERRLLPFLYMIDDVEKWNDIDELKKANPNMGVSVKESFFMDEIAVAEGSFGNWEMDSVLGKRGKSKNTLLVLTERKTRNEIIFKLPDHTDEAVVAALDRLERKWGAEMFKRVFKTITVDNGSEFADAEGLQRSIINEGEKRTKVYYCHPYSSWERGTNEVTNKMIRRKIPKGTNFDDRTEEEVESIENWINGYPRKIHGYHSAGELFEEEVKQLA